MNRLQDFVQFLARTLYIFGNLLLLATVVLWYLSDTNRLTIAGLEPVSVGVTTILSYLGALLAWLANKGENREERDHSQEWRNRQQLIQNVKASWIEGVRNQSLHKSVWIELEDNFSTQIETRN